MSTKEKSLQEACIDQEGELMGQKKVDQTLELLRGKLLSPMRKEVQRHYLRYHSCFKTTFDSFLTKLNISNGLILSDYSLF